jgi:hypothetical protein
MKEELITMPEFSRALKIKDCITRKWILLSNIRYFKLGAKLIRIPASEIERLLSEIPARQVRNDI